ncbi:hypothetical protein HW932_21020 [Allochromatium humboldtianum]|uniref:Uncharacterized protein n=1 Tax=Allochromatium humboldtianum TaxID=504901 RepID=A0A850RS40_9GAMM|nr:hypothetical protein [Allochromatium humboldtianum]NVZ11733.1 hypothetical protein [Allochromatium humboldtianum]
MSAIKRIHVSIGNKATTVSMDETLFIYLEQRLDKHLSVREWVQSQIDKMLSDKLLSEHERASSLSRRIQSRAIHLVAECSRV